MMTFNRQRHPGSGPRVRKGSKCAAASAAIFTLERNDTKHVPTPFISVYRDAAPGFYFAFYYFLLRTRKTRGANLGFRLVKLPSLYESAQFSSAFETSGLGVSRSNSWRAATRIHPPQPFTDF